MQNPLISVIVPIYNTEKYIHQCIDSIIGQTYSNLEIILVDDGSPDNCPAICDEYGAKDDRVKVIHKSNGGQSSARNAALDICKGEYIAFVDSDDWLEPSAYAEMMEFAVKEKLDVVYCRPQEISDSGEITATRYHYYDDKTVCESRDIAVRTLKNEISAEPWLKICHCDCWGKLRFPEGRIYEDVAIAFYPLINAKRKVGFLDRALYNYRINLSGTTQSRKPVARYHFFLSLKERYEYAKNNMPEAEDASRAWAARFAMGAYLDYHCQGWKELEPYMDEVEGFLIENKGKLVSSEAMSKSQKLSLRLFYFSRKAFVTAYKGFTGLRGK